ncbi:MAG: ferritin-like domain-containing protein [Hyphomonadaceae bacterium]|nr:ferritin-like domain-containing protein [Hyphomonadaceae bacterium]
MADGILDSGPSREQLIHALYEAAELEHNLMCTYLYAAFSLKSEGEGLSAAETEAVARWRKAIIDVAIDEMGHLAAVWNITSALGGQPRFGRGNFPIDPGYLPAGLVVKLAPFNAEVLQHFIYLERPVGSDEREGEGFESQGFKRSVGLNRLTPMGVDYETVGVFYHKLGTGLRALSERVGESNAFAGDRTLQLGPAEIDLNGIKPVICLKTALQAFDAIVTQGEGASADSADSHFHKFCAIRAEHRKLNALNPDFKPAWPAAVNPVLRKPPNPQGRVWLEDEEAIAIVDLANSCYQLMSRLLGYAYGVKSPHPEKGLAVDLGISLMRACALLGEHAARLPAGPSNPDCHAGMSFTALRDSSPFPQSEGARRFFVERFEEFAAVAAKLASNGDQRTLAAAKLLAELAKRAANSFVEAGKAAPANPPLPPPKSSPGQEATTKAGGIETVVGDSVTIDFEAKRCIHARLCVTGAPKVFLANVEGPWIHPNAMDAEKLVAIAEACPSGAIRYRRNDGRPEEAPPPVNLAAIREGGPYAVRGDIMLDGKRAGYRMTLCRCGASKNKPFCDGSHHDIHFDASGEPPTGKADMLEVRDGQLNIDPQTDGPLRVRGNLEITAGTGRVVARIKGAYLCRCGGSQNKPFCDGTHAKIGFKS